MLGTSWHHHEVASFDILVFASNGGFAYSRGKGQGLVDGVNLRESAVGLLETMLRRWKPVSKEH